MKDKRLMQNEKSEFTNLCMSFVHNDKLTGVPREHKMEKLLYVIRGKIRFSEIGGHYDLTAEEGNIIYIPKGDITVTNVLENDTKILSIKYVSPTDRMLGNAKVITKEHNEEAVSTAASIAQQLRDHRDMEHSYFCMLTYKLIYEINRYRENQVAPKFHKLFPVMKELRAHPEKEHKIQDYAEMCMMSEVGFRKLFMEYTGKSPVEYRTELRLKMAADMLSDDDCSVTEAAMRSGFNSVSFFCREFKKHYGYSAGNIK